MASPSLARQALVVVLGDLGHSPRMQNHVRELVDMGYLVDFLGYSESELPVDIRSDRVSIISLPSCRLELKWMPTIMVMLLNLMIRLMVQSMVFAWITLLRLKRPEIIVVQSPPVLPTILVCYLLAKVRRAKLIVDWHNIGYTVLAQKVKLPILIAIAKAIELLLAKVGDLNFVVSNSQRQWMQINAGISAITLYDRPVPSRFSPLPPSERRDARRKIRERLGWDPQDDIPLIVSSTSWTPDEDFNMLVKALTQIKGRAQLLVTGKGPLKAFYEQQILELGLRNVQFATLWLSFEDYARLLGAADLGICLHSSSSGVDLPMKATDMMAAGLPVAAIRFPAIAELLEDGVTGFLFDDSSVLANIINDVVGNASKLKRIKSPNLETWHEQWQRVVRPLLDARAKREGK